MLVPTSGGSESGKTDRPSAGKPNHMCYWGALRGSNDPDLGGMMRAAAGGNLGKLFNPSTSVSSSVKWDSCYLIGLL